MMTTHENFTKRSIAVEAVCAHFAGMLGETLPPGLYLVATPIGNLGDVSLRALATLARADHLYCEDTRRSRKLLSAFGISRPLKIYHDHSPPAVRERILDLLRGGASVALMSDAGTPLVCDPGYKLAREAMASGCFVTTAPGACAAIAALSTSGLPSDRFFFAGFPPPRPEARRRSFAALADMPATLIFYESATRLEATLADMAAAFPGREIAVSREITKLHEETRRGALPEFAAGPPFDSLKGEFTITLGPLPVASEKTEDEISRALLAALEIHSVRDAVDAVVEMHKVKRRRVYDMANKLKNRQGDGDACGE